MEDARDVYRTENDAGTRSRLGLQSKRLLADLESWKHSMPEAYRHTGKNADSVPAHRQRDRIVRLSSVGPALVFEDW